MAIGSPSGNCGPIQTVRRTGRRNLYPNLSREPMDRLFGFPQVTEWPMMKSTANVGVIILLILMASCSRQRDNKPRATQPSGFYQTPAAVFNAHREAAQKRDWRKCFDCFTPDYQKNAIFELVLQC